MAAQRSVVQREHLTAPADLIAANVNVRHRGVGNPTTRTVLSCGYRCVTDSIPSLAGYSPAAASEQPARQAGGAHEPGRKHWRHQQQDSRRTL